MRRGLDVLLLSAFGMPAHSAELDPLLEQHIAQEPGPHQVIITFHDMNAVDSLDATLGVTVTRLQTLPMAAAVLTEEQIAEVVQWASVVSIYSTAPVRYHNHAHTTSGYGTHVAGTVASSEIASGGDERRPDYYYHTIGGTSTATPFGAGTVGTVQFDVDSDVVGIKAQLAWDGLSNLDLYLKDPNGNTVASSTTLANPETLEYAVDTPGTYTYEVVGYITATTTYTLNRTTTHVRE